MSNLNEMTREQKVAIYVIAELENQGHQVRMNKKKIALASQGYAKYVILKASGFRPSAEEWAGMAMAIEVAE